MQRPSIHLPEVGPMRRQVLTGGPSHQTEVVCGMDGGFRPLLLHLNRPPPACKPGAPTLCMSHNLFIVVPLLPATSYLFARLTSGHTSRLAFCLFLCHLLSFAHLYHFIALLLPLPLNPLLSLWRLSCSISFYPSTCLFFPSCPITSFPFLYHFVYCVWFSPLFFKEFTGWADVISSLTFSFLRDRQDGKLMRSQDMFFAFSGTNTAFKSGSSFFESSNFSIKLKVCRERPCQLYVLKHGSHFTAISSWANGLFLIKHLKFICSLVNKTTRKPCKPEQLFMNVMKWEFSS